MIREKSYTLVGTIKPFNQLWSSQRFITYPNLFVTDQEMQSYEKEVRTIWFYRLDPARTDIDPEEFYKGFQESNQKRRSYSTPTFTEVPSGAATAPISWPSA